MLRTANHTYLGRYYHALEQKGRLSIPSSFRGQLQGKAVITAGLDGCLFLHDSSSWQNLLDSTANLSLTRRNNRNWTRYLANNAAWVDLDSQGRILIPEPLRQLAHLTGTVVIVGSVDRIEIWDQTVYHTYLDGLIENAAEIAESVIQDQSA